MEDLRVLGIFVIAGPSLVDVEFTRGPAEGEGRLYPGPLRHLTVVVDVTVEEVGQPRAVGGARHLLWEGRVRQVEGHITRRDLVCWCRKDVRGVVGELLDGP